MPRKFSSISVIFTNGAFAPLSMNPGSVLWSIASNSFDSSKGDENGSVEKGTFTSKALFSTLIKLQNVKKTKQHL